MDTRRMLRLLAVVALVAAMALSATPATASGGGGCGRPVTDALGTTVSIRMFCFTPTLARVRPGQVVTFVNHDEFAHTVLGANGAWGSFELLKGGQELTYRFARSGIYSFVCTLHPGMVGTVVVGNGKGPGAIGTTTAAGPVTLVALSPSPEIVPTGTASNLPRVDAGPWPAATVAAFAMFLLAGGAFLVERRR